MPPLTQDQFTEALTDAYAHLYDIVHLRTHRLLDLLTAASGAGDTPLAPKERAWQLHRLLLDAVHEIKPAAGADVLSRQWRRHRLMVLRYIKAQEPQAVADELNISRRHFYREHAAAMESLASILWTRHEIASRPASTAADTANQTEMLAERPDAPSASDDNLAHLRMEAARMAQANRYASLTTVCASVTPLVTALLHERNLTTRWSVPDTLPHVAVDPNLLKQLLLGLVTLLAESMQAESMQAGSMQAGSMQAESMQAGSMLTGEIVIAGQMQGTSAESAGTVHLTVRREATVGAPDLPPSTDGLRERLTGLREMASLGGASLHALTATDSATSEEAGCGFRLELTPTQRTVLVVDDNEDVLHLFRRYLTPHHYHVVTTTLPQEVHDLARQVHPLAITLDLMMPGQDGWDLLQLLLHQPETRHIPLVVCSVLKQQDLALALGATAFIEKPVTEQRLLAVLNDLQQREQAGSPTAS